MFDNLLDAQDRPLAEDYGWVTARDGTRLPFPIPPPAKTKTAPLYSTVIKFGSCWIADVQQPHLVGHGWVLHTLILFSGFTRSLHFSSSMVPMVLSLQTGFDNWVPPPQVLEHADQSLNCQRYSVSFGLPSFRIVYEYEMPTFLLVPGLIICGHNLL